MGIEAIIDEFFDAIGNTGGDIAEALGEWFYTKNDDGSKSINIGEVLPLILGIGNATGLFDRDQDPVGWQGTIKPKQAIRERVETNYDPERRPGSYGQQYFTDTTYVDPTKTDEVAEAQAAASAEAAEIFDANVARKDEIGPLLEAMKNPHTNFENKPDPEEVGREGMAAGGPVHNKGVMGLYMGGPTDGMADQIPASISGVQPAALSDGEFVVPADAVSHLGNGNSNAGAQQLMQMIESVRQARTGNPQQGKQINPNKFMPGAR